MDTKNKKYFAFNDASKNQRW